MRKEILAIIGMSILLFLSGCPAPQENSKDEDAQTPEENPPSALSAPAAPTLIGGNGFLSVSWTAVANATAYEVWYHSSDASASATKFGDISSGTTAIIGGLVNDTRYYVWIKAKNGSLTSDFSLSSNANPLAIAPAAPASPNLSAGDGRLEASWDAVPGATAYEVWYHTLDDFSSAAKFGSDVDSGTSTTITDLANGAIYYVWINAKNEFGTSGIGPSSGMQLVPNIPASLSLTSGLTQITATWTAVTGANAYEAWYGTTSDTASASKFGGDIESGATVTISGLENATVYYVWIKSKNGTGTSGFGASNSINTTVSIGEIMAGKGSFIDNDRISFGKTFAATPSIVVNAYDSGGKALICGVRTEAGVAPDRTGFTLKLSDLDGVPVTSAATVQWIAIRTNSGDKVLAQARTDAYRYDGEYIAFDHAFSGVPRVICTGYDDTMEYPIIAAAYSIDQNGFIIALKDCDGNPSTASLHYLAIIPPSPLAFTNYYEEASIISSAQFSNNNGVTTFDLGRAPTAAICSSWKGASFLPNCAAARNIGRYGFEFSIYDYDGTAATDAWTDWIAVGIK
jgi:hypothetical protein